MGDPLDRPATPARIGIATEAAGLPPDATLRALVLAAASPSAAAWTRFLAVALLLLGTGLVLAGVISFFAFNWATLGKFAKFALLEGAVAACALLGWWRLRDVTGRVALSAAAVLVGPLLGVFGQTYQTGADPWGLFAAWALLIAPWVIVACFTPLWMLEIALCDLTLVLVWMEVLDIGEWHLMLLFSLLAGIHAIAVTAWEWQRHRAVPWLDALWAPRLLVATAFGFLLVPTIAVVIGDFVLDASRVVGFFALWAAVAGVFVVYRQVREDLFMLTVAGGSVLVVLTVGVGRLIFEELKLEIVGALMMALFVIVEVVVGVSWLRRSVRAEVE